ncbi:MAG: hypothetical protein WC802_02720 [Patescibacteria group bacterium]|jgi:antitoxin (DNA-binding transcriptional repressor) of toxin-antitoxin stability system
MNVKTITVRELHQNMPAIGAAVKRGQRYIVVRHARPLFSIAEPEAVEPKTYKIADLVGIYKGDKHLSRDIDKILYS